LPGAAPGPYHETMARSARRVLRTSTLRIVPLTLLLGCASGADETNPSLSGFSASQGPGSDPSASSTPTSTMGSTGVLPTGDGSGSSGRDDTTMRETTTETPDPITSTSADETAGDVTSTSGVDDTSTSSDDTTGPVILCGNGMIDAFEECDGAALGDMDCTSFGFTGGSLTCTPQCVYDKAMCTSPSCGDGTVDMGEECDCGQQGANCTAPQLGNAACTTLPAPNGGNYSGGALTCNSPQSCSLNKAACTFCGDGIKNAAEQCDAADLGGATCQSQGFVAGNISCTAMCGFNTGGCSNCGNNVVDGGETCDGNNFNGQTCQSIDPSKFAGGTLSCSNCNSISTSGCNSGNCCSTGPAGNCSVPAILNCTCGADPFCCNNSWDGLCVNQAKACGAVCP
jgi:hypothetical protein